MGAKWLPVILALCLVADASGQSATCVGVATNCQTMMTGLQNDLAAVFAAASNFCPYLKKLYHDPTTGCMKGQTAQCCCCDKAGFTDTLNKMMREQAELQSVWNMDSNKACKDKPLQCEVDCSKCSRPAPRSKVCEPWRVLDDARER